jgi:hypothetical protein
MKIYLGFALLVLCATTLAQQPATPAQQPATSAKPPAVPTTVRQIKEALEESPNPILYTKQILKKRFKIDTITVTQTRHFGGLPYGPKDEQFLVQLLSKAPNEFYHISQIFIDTSVFRYRIADSIGNMILKKLKDGTETFEQLAKTWSTSGEVNANGDLGWIARGALYPVIEHEVLAHKKGEVFKIWSRAGLNIIRKDDDPRQDTGFALMMQVFL